MARVDGGRRRSPLLAGGVLLLTLAAALVAAYAVIGSSVDADGTLREPFAFIPLAWLCGLFGTILVVVAVRRSRRQRTGVDD